MNADRFLLLESLFNSALSLDRGARDSFLEAKCGTDPALRAQVERMLARDAGGPTLAGAHEEIGRVVRGVLAGPNESPGDRVGRYMLRALIGEGGFGTVYLAEQTEPVRREVALKVIKLGMDTDRVIARFEAERQALAMMSHPGIATVLDAGSTPAGKPYFVMELVRGQPITEYCDRVRLPVNQRLELFIQVCGAVQHAHQKGIIHRDLKPSNVLVGDSEGVPLPKIIDFGIAKATGTQSSEPTLRTEAKQFIGTPEYMSPEQTEGPGGDIDTRSDIYSLGVLLYELLTGTTPFESSILRSAPYAEMQRIIRESPPSRPSSRLGMLAGGERSRPTPAAAGRAAPVNPVGAAADADSARLGMIAQSRGVESRTLRRQLRGDLDWITLKCLAKERERRYSTAQELALDIRRHLKREPVVAGPPSVRYRMRKFVVRHRGALAAGSLVLGALLAGLGIATVGLVRANEQRDRAEIALRFLEDMLASPDPNRGSGSGMTIREALDLASKRLDDGGLRAQPGVEAKIRRTLGGTYMAMGMYDRAAPHLERSMELAREAFGARSAELAMAWNDLGELRRMRGELDSAELAYAAAVSIQERSPPSVATAQTLNNFGLLRQTQGRFEEAEGLQRRSLEMRLGVVGGDDPEVATSYNNLGSLNSSMGRLGEAEQYYRQSLRMRVRLLGEGHWRVANTQVNLARVLLEGGNIAEAEDLTVRAAATTEKSLGETHTQMGRLLLTLGSIRRAQKRYEEAEGLLGRSLEVQRAALPAGHPEIAHSLCGLGAFLIEVGRFGEAEKPLREALDIRRNKLNSTHPLIGVTASLLGEALMGVGRLDEAGNLLREGYGLLKNSPYSTVKNRREAAARLVRLARLEDNAADVQRWLTEAESLR